LNAALSQSSEEVLAVEDPTDVEISGSGWLWALGPEEPFNIFFECFELDVLVLNIKLFLNNLSHDRYLRGRTPEAVMDHAELRNTCVSHLVDAHLHVCCIM